MPLLQQTAGNGKFGKIEDAREDISRESDKSHGGKTSIFYLTDIVVYIDSVHNKLAGAPKR
jgi:hypothetical protein